MLLWPTNVVVVMSVAETSTSIFRPTHICEVISLRWNKSNIYSGPDLQIHMFPDCFQATVANILENLKVFDHRSKIHTNLSARGRAVFFNVINVPLNFCLNVKSFVFSKHFIDHTNEATLHYLLRVSLPPSNFLLFLHRSVWTFNKYYIPSELARWKYISGVC
jgi:hypothetical protein